MTTLSSSNFSRAIMRGHYVALLGLHKQHEGFAAEQHNQ
jgi:hypothetical protein